MPDLVRHFTLPWQILWLQSNAFGRHIISSVGQYLRMEDILAIFENFTKSLQFVEIKRTEEEWQENKSTFFSVCCSLTSSFSFIVPTMVVSSHHVISDVSVVIHSWCKETDTVFTEKWMRLSYSLSKINNCSVSFILVQHILPIYVQMSFGVIIPCRCNFFHECIMHTAK